MFFQDLILLLQNYWSDQGCLITQPYDVEKGAGTFNPDTFLRSLGPEPFNAAYVEPCRRPADGRYGENPLRMQRYFQFQVVMKPNPINLMELYLNSLRGMGIKSEDHDIRFVHDDWESPTLGAWGLGWEVWVDGMEVTQFTYFQQVGGIELQPVMGEITYGLERLCMFLQEVDNVYDLAYNKQFSYGDLFHLGEVQCSRYNFELADVSLQRDLFQKYEVECNRLCEVENALSAVDCCLKASHAFNLLDARGAISVNERQGYILRVRALARKIAETWLKNREDLNFPLMKNSIASTLDAQPLKSRVAEAELSMTAAKRGNVLLELGIEEMPARVFPRLTHELMNLIKKYIEPLDLDIADVKINLTPCRISIALSSILLKQPDQELSVKGPPLNIAKDENNNWTKAAQGFAAKNDIDVESLSVKDINGVEYLYAEVNQIGKSANKLLTEILPDFFSAIPWYKKMRWGAEDTAFVRPVRWLVAMVDDQILPAAFANAASSNKSYGHRFLSLGDIQVTPDYTTYIEKLRDAFVIVDHCERKALIRSQLVDLAANKNLCWNDDDELLSEVTNLVEFPVPVLCQFAEHYLNIPDVVLISEMKEHQKYFALHNSDGSLSNSFIVISNMKVNNDDVIRTGYQKVLKSRFSDAEFFLQEDLKIALDERVSKLSEIIFQQKLGSVLDKIERIKTLASLIAQSVSLSLPQQESIQKIATLCKADLNTLMVGEFPKLQGEIGRYYANRQSLPDIVSNGIVEHYLPKSLSDAFPENVESAIVGIADRIDTIVGIFSIGKAPTGSADPFAVRRACLTSIALIVDQELKLNIGALIDSSIKCCSERLPGVKCDDIKASILEFYRMRVIGFFQENSCAKIKNGFTLDCIKSTLNASSDWKDLVDLYHRLQAMEEFHLRDDFTDVAATFKRANNIIKNDDISGAVDPALFNADAEKQLWNAIQRIQNTLAESLENKDYLAALQQIVPLHAPANDFFDKVLVNDPDAAIRKNRQRLVKNVVGIVLQVANFSELHEH